MAFDPENELERALEEAFANPDARGTFHRLLLESEIFVLGVAEKPGADAPAGSTTQLRLPQIEFRNRAYHPIFTSERRMQPFAKEHPQFFSMLGRELFECTRGASFLLNSGSEGAKELPAEEIAWALNPGLAGASQPEGRIVISQPAEFPSALAAGLCALFAARPQVEAAYLGEMRITGRDDPPHAIVGVKMQGLWDPLAQEIQRLVATLPQGTRVAAMQIGNDEVRNVLGDMLTRFEPFYTRKTALH
ncbi:MAG: enhanced serine sensitivity protein SseB C-terminal domain-containing protein [Alphaproteobacteria bacterium]